MINKKNMKQVSALIALTQASLSITIAQPKPFSEKMPGSKPSSFTINS